MKLLPLILLAPLCVSAQVVDVVDNLAESVIVTPRAVYIAEHKCAHIAKGAKVTVVTQKKTAVKTLVDLATGKTCDVTLIKRIAL